MGEHRPAEDLWVRVDDRTAYRVSRAPSHEIDAMVLFGHITSARLKAISLREITDQPQYFSLAAGTLPTEDQLANPAKRLAVHGSGPVSIVTVDQGEGPERVREVSVIRDGEKVLEWRPKAVTELTTEQWYATTAALYLYVAEVHPRSATKQLASYCDVAFTTAVRWVREARARELLPPTDRPRNQTATKQQGSV